MSDVGKKLEDKSVSAFSANSAEKAKRKSLSAVFPEKVDERASRLGRFAPEKPKTELERELDTEKHFNELKRGSSTDLLFPMEDLTGGVAPQPGSRNSGRFSLPRSRQVRSRATRKCTLYEVDDSFDDTSSNGKVQLQTQSSFTERTPPASSLMKRKKRSDAAKFKKMSLMNNALNSSQRRLGGKPTAGKLKGLVSVSHREKKEFSFSQFDIALENDNEEEDDDENKTAPMPLHRTMSRNSEKKKSRVPDSSLMAYSTSFQELKDKNEI